MKPWLRLALVIGALFSGPWLAAQESLVGRQQATVHWGSLRTPYSVVQSGFQYRVEGAGSASGWELNLREDAFGTFWAVGSPSFDLSAAMTYQQTGPWQGTRWGVGAGALVEARLSPDERSAAQTGGAPLVHFLVSGSFPTGVPGLTWGARIPVQLDVYRNGVAFDCEPELSWVYGWAVIVLHEKNRFLWGGKAAGTEFRWDTDVGVGAVF